MVESGCALSDLRSELSKFPQVLMNVSVPFGGQQLLESEVLMDEIARAKEAVGESGRVLVRASGTEPIIRVMVEATDSVLTRTIAEHLCAIIEQNACHLTA